MAVEALDAVFSDLPQQRIPEVAAQDIADGIDEVMTHDGIVIRDVFEPEQIFAIRALVPETGKRRAYLSPTLRRHPDLQLDLIDENAEQIGANIAHYLGQPATLWGLNVLGPDILRAGETPMHIDRRNVIVSMSANLDNGTYVDGTRGQTLFYAKRVAPVDERFSRIRDSVRKSPPALSDMAVAELGPGDAVIISRGTWHGTTAADKRRSVTYRSRGMVLADLR